MNGQANPKLFRELSEPYESLEEANTALDAFYKDLEDIRAKHGIPNLYCILAFAAVQGDEEVESMTSLSFGDSMRRYPMTAWAYGREQADHESLMKQIIAESLKKGRAR